MSQPSKKLTLAAAAAAEALAEAASLEAESMAQKELTQTVDSVKESFDNNLNRVVQTMKSSNDNFDAKMNTLNQHVKDEISALKDEITSVKMLLEEEKKQKTLDRALKLAYLGSFTYYTYEEHRGYSPHVSRQFAEATIGWFLLGQGAVLPSDATLEQSFEGSGEHYNIYNYNKEAREKEAAIKREKEDASRKAFRAEFIKQIKGLIMREPRVESRNDGKFVIYYS